MKRSIQLYDRAGNLVHAGQVEGAPDVIFFGVRAYYSPVPSRGRRYREVSCARIAEPAAVEMGAVLFSEASRTNAISGDGPGRGLLP